MTFLRGREPATTTNSDHEGNTPGDADRVGPGDLGDPGAPVDAADGPAASSADASWSPVAVETHISVLFLVGDRAFKLKKPVRLPILDWRTREAREAACHREVELNSRLAPDVYLGVDDIVANGEVVDHLVVMRRMPADRRLRAVLVDGADVAVQLHDLARLLARFHAGARRSAVIAADATVDAVADRWATNLRVLRGRVGDVSDPTTVDAGVVARITALVDRYLAGRRALFDARIDAGMIVDGHGDLMAEDVYLLDDGPRVLDCIEFSDRLRHVDVLDDVCFLAMDIERFGSRAAADDFLDAYVAASGEHHPASLAHHWIAYRAGVRAYVACVRAAQGDAHAAADIAEARGLLDLALAHLQEGRVRLVLVGGLPGTGKSTVANAIGAARDWTVLHSDVVRKELLGLRPTDPARAAFGEGAYSDDHTSATYDALLERAIARLVMGESVVLDASWTDPRLRERAVAAAHDCDSDLVVLECRAPRDVAATRIATRVDATGSDATAQVAAAMARSTSPWTGAVVLDTTADLDVTISGALAAVDRPATFD